MKNIVNKFTIQFCTVNGSGSATANNVVLKSIFHLGIPVSGRNNLPSNIQGMPTWYTIRVDSEGFLGRNEELDIVVAMNPETIDQDVKKLHAGNVLLYNEKIKLPSLPQGIHIHALPVEEIVKKSETKPQLAGYLSSMVYVGVLCYLLNIPLKIIKQIIEEHFLGKKTAIMPNIAVLDLAFEWAEAHIQKTDSYLLEPLQKTDGMIMTDGNIAAALGALYGGLQFMAWYPITPATSLAETVNEYLPKIRTIETTGKQTCVVVQAEDELAAIGMVVGAGWGGLRAMTSTSGPGLSLMAEYLGLAYYAEVPLVVWDVQRVGPSTGLPTHTSQGDLTFSYFLGHGDKDFIILIPGTVNECFEFGWQALDIAELAQTPVIVLSDLELGMNQWMTDAFQYPVTPIKRGKVLWEKEFRKLKLQSNKKWGRYLDIDGDGIPYRTLPGNTELGAAYFARGTGHDEFAQYSELPEVWEKGMVRLKKKFKTITQYLPKNISTSIDGAEIGLIAYGSNGFAAEEAVYKMNAIGTKIDNIRIRSIPFQEDVEKFLEEHKSVYVAESNRDGQMCQLLRMRYSKYSSKLKSIAYSDGQSITAAQIIENIKEMEKEK